MMGEYDAGYENCIDSMVRQMEDMQFRIDNLHRENVKLRELVRTLHHCAARGECDVCAMRDGRGLDEDTVCLAMHDRMRELGVEV